MISKGTTIYCVDTSAWIFAADNFLLGDDRFKQLWDWLHDFAETGRLIAPDEVLVELDGDKAIGPWLKKRKSLIIRDQTEAAIQTLFKNIDSTYPRLTRKGKAMAKNQADAWVIAMALHKKAVVVSQENLRQNARDRCIPGVCVLEGVTHMYVHDFLRAESS